MLSNLCFNVALQRYAASKLLSSQSNQCNIASRLCKVSRLMESTIAWKTRTIFMVHAVLQNTLQAPLCQSQPFSSVFLQVCRDLPLMHSTIAWKRREQAFSLWGTQCILCCSVLLCTPAASRFCLNLTTFMRGCCSSIYAVLLHQYSATFWGTQCILCCSVLLCTPAASRGCCSSTDVGSFLTCMMIKSSQVHLQ